MTNSNTLLIIDDEAPIRRLSKRILNQLNINTLDAATGTEGLELLEQNHDVDGVLLDIHLPDGAGEEWARKYREKNKDLPIIFFSGVNRPNYCKDDSPEANFFIKKPFTPQSMKEVLEKVFS